MVLQATAADQHDTNSQQQHHDEARHTNSRCPDERTDIMMTNMTQTLNNNIMMKQDTRIRDGVMSEQSNHSCSGPRDFEPSSKKKLSQVSSKDNSSSRAAVSSSNDPKKAPWRNRSASDVAIHLYRSACASFLLGTASFCLPSTTMIASQPVSFWAVMQSFFRFTCTRCPCHSPSNSTPHLERIFATTWSTSE